MIFRPLCIFILTGALLWGADHFYSAYLQRQEPVGNLRIAQADIDRMAEQFRRDHGRDPEAAELKRLLDAALQNRLLVKEALRLGLHQNDPVVAQRLKQNLAFLEAETQPELLKTMLQQDPVVKRRMKERMEALLLADWQSRQSQAMRQQALQNFYAQNNKRYSSGKRYRLMHQWSADHKQNGVSFVGQHQLLSRDNLSRLFSEPLVDRIVAIEQVGAKINFNAPGGNHYIQILAIEPGQPEPLEKIRARVVRDFQRSLNQKLVKEYVANMLDFYRLDLPVGYRQILARQQEWLLMNPEPVNIATESASS